MSRGDHIFVRRALYAHHGIDLGDGTVVHFSGEPANKRAAAICRCTIAEFERGGRVQVRRYASVLDAEATVARALSRLGEAGYDLVFNNCEHFACWCATGKHQSAQIEAAAASTGLVGGTSVLAAGGLSIVASAGEVAGLSGPGIMSGLSGLGGSVVAGVSLLSLAPAALSIGVMHLALRDREIDSNGERHARAVGRAASVAGGLGGVYITGQALAAAGSVAGLSAAGISSGLAAIGGIVGGGMALGAAILIAMPAVVAALIGYAAYRGARASRRHPLPPMELGFTG